MKIIKIGCPENSVSSLWKYNETFTSTNPHPPYGIWMNGWLAPSSSSEAITPMRGYSLFVNSGTTMNLSGSLNSGYTSYSVTYTNSADPGDHGWNLIGNPFPSPVDWNSASGWNRVLIQNAFYIYQPLTGSAGQYGSYVSGVSTHGVTNIIPAMQAFWVRSKGMLSPATVAISNSARTTNMNQTFFKKAAQCLCCD